MLPKWVYGHAMNNGASALAAQKIMAALESSGESLVWLADKSGQARETTRRKIGKGVGELTMGEIMAYCKPLNLEPGRLADDAIREAVA